MPLKDPIARKKYLKDYELKNRKTLREYKLKWKLANQERANGWQKKYYRTHKEKHNAWVKKNYMENREKIRERARNTSYRINYGISLDDVNKMYEKQNGRCLLCYGEMGNIGEGVKKLSPVIDHCHKTGKIRGLIHSRCNILIGMAGDSKEVLILAVKYLETHGA